MYIRAIKLVQWERSRSTVHVGAQDFCLEEQTKSNFILKHKMIYDRVCASCLFKTMTSWPCPRFVRNAAYNSVFWDKSHSLGCCGWVDTGWEGIRISLVHPGLAQLPVRWLGESAALPLGSKFSPCDGTRRGNSGSLSWFCRKTNSRNFLDLIYSWIYADDTCKAYQI